MSLWKDLVDIPDRKENWVLKLNSGLQEDRRGETVDDYVVTDSLADRFAQALSLLRSGLGIGGFSEPESKGAFLHGSFGSGKSHFMAILGLLLEGYRPARELENLTSVVTDHEWMDDVELLHIPFHMLGKRSMEHGVFSRYIDWVQEHRPEASLPSLYRSAPIIEHAEKMRQMAGDEKFFDNLNESTDGGGPSRGGLDWGETDDRRWDAESFERAKEASPSSSEHRELLTALIDSGVAGLAEDLMGVSGQGFIDFDEGLARISEHARDELGVDGVLLFLDELVLWLSRQGAEPAFVDDELQKVDKLVEFENERAAPIFSFIARQKDLSEMLGSAIDKDEMRDIGLAEDFLRNRFEDIRLQDRNLPYVASKRLLEPRDDRAREQVERSFERTWEELDPDRRDVLLTNRYDKEDFRRVYPFTPALVRALVVLSNELQRERTALDILQRLLIEHRESLDLGELVPVGDLWPMLEEGEKPEDPARERLFDNARSLRRESLIPYLEDEHDLEWASAEPGDDGYADFRDDLRLMDTILLGELVSDPPQFDDMDAETLLAFNPGVEQTPLPGGHGSLARVREKLDRWTAEIPELQYKRAPNEKVGLQLKGVAIHDIIEKAADKDNDKARREAVLELLFDEMDYDADDQGPMLRREFQFEWRGDRRTLEVAYCNVRTQNFDQMEPSSQDRWLLMIDYPFDEGNNGPKDDVQNLARYEDERGHADTIAWLPLHLNQQGRDLLSKYVRAKKVSENFDAYSGDVPPVDRERAATNVDREVEICERQLKDTLRAAYGVNPHGDDQRLDEAVYIDHLQSLAEGHDPERPAAKQFDEMLPSLGREAFDHKYAASPKIPHERLQPRQVEEMHRVIRESIDTGKGVYIDPSGLRERLSNYAEPLELGEMGDNRFSHSDTWLHRLDRQLDPGDDGVEVGEVFDVVDPPDDPRGLADELRDLIVLAYADMDHMIVTRQGMGGMEDPKPGKLRPDDRLEYRDLPGEQSWEAAGELADEVFEVEPPRNRNPRTVHQLAREIREEVEPRARAGRQLADLLRKKVTRYLDYDEEAIRDAPRWRDADEVRKLVEAVDTDDDADLVERLASLDLEGDDRSAVAQSFGRAAEHVRVLEDLNWYVFEKLRNRVEEGDDALESTLEDVREIVESADYTGRKLTELRELERSVNKALIDTTNGGGGGSGDDGGDGGGDAVPSETATFTGSSLEQLKQKTDRRLADLVDRMEVDPDDPDREVTVELTLSVEGDDT